MKNSKRILLWLALIIVALITIPFFIPTQRYLEKAQEVASEALGMPVRIESMRFAILPTPRAHIGGVVAGEQQEISLQNLSVVASLPALLSGKVEISSLNIEHPVLKKSGVDKLIALASPKKGDEKSESAVVIRNIHLSDAKIEWPDATIPAFDAEVEMDAQNRLAAADLNTTDDALKLHLVPQGEQHQITLQAHNWRVPFAEWLKIDDVQSAMVLNGNNLQIDALKARLFGGALDMHGSLNWQSSWQFKSKFKASQIALPQVFAALGKKSPLSGNLTANGDCRMSAKTAGKLADNLAVDSQFKIENGVLHGVDLLKVASLLLKSGAGGETQFDTFTGNAQVRGKQYKLSNLNVQSGLLGATGHVTVAPSKALSGEVKVEVKNSAKMVAIPMNVSGTLDSPMVFPTKSALIGGALGTAVLPGAGTAAGVQAAEKAEKMLKGLFGD